MCQSFPPGKQVEVTTAILEFANEFSGLSIPELFPAVHKKIFSTLKILPYTNDIVEYEESRR